MDPVCEICGAVHHPRQAHRFGEVVVNKVVVNVKGDRNKDRHKNGDARRVYMRDYMRRRRAGDPL